MIQYPKLTNQFILDRLELPPGKINMVLDTDTYNEIDDQFALVYALQSVDRLNVEAIYAAPFFNNRSTGPEEGMQKSYEEILRLLDLLNISPEGFVFKGSTRYLESLETPCKSDAALDFVNRAMAAEEPLYVVAVGAITNIASAILLEPKIIEKIVVVWLGGHALYWPHTKEFNLEQDVLAASVLFDCGVPLIQVPCANVVSRLITTVPELEHYLAGKNETADYLLRIFKEYREDHFWWSKEIWDMAAVAYLINPAWTPSDIVHSPIVTDQMTWSVDARRHFIKSVNYINRDAIFRDFFNKI